ADYFGHESVVFRVDDLNLTGGGAKTASCSFDVDIENWPDDPVAVAGNDQNALEGALVNFDGSGSHDVDGDSLIYSWDFGDGTSGVGGVKPTHAYSNEGI